MSEPHGKMTLVELKATRQNRFGNVLKPVNADTRTRSSSQSKILERQWLDNASEARFNSKRATAAKSENDGGGKSDVNNKKKDNRSTQTLPPDLSRKSTERKRAEDHFRKWKKIPEGWDLQFASLCLEHMKREENRLMPTQPPASANIRPHMRAVLADWLVQVQHHLRLLPSTLYLAMQYVDRYVQTRYTDLAEYQCLGVAAIFLASKLEERYTAEVTELVYLTDNTFTVSQVVGMEKVVLETLEFRLATPEASWFLRLGVDACPDTPDDTKDSVLLRSLYFLDLTMTDEIWPKLAPSFAAAASLALSLEVEKVKYPRNVEVLFGYRWKELVNLMSHMAFLTAKSEKAPLNGCFQKYCSVSQYGALARGGWVDGAVIRTFADAYRE